MSTTFAVIKYNPYKKVEVAHRFSKGKGEVGITWLSTKNYSDKTKVYPLDNTAQGVETIGDLRKLSQTNKTEL